ncbi:MAG: RDD family protein [Actinomycetota bacterium]|nr:RDD family protein [Actinomycetota bacterium]
MEYEDRLKIVTPEGVELELQLAGLGSRFIAQSIDLLIKFALILLIVLTFSWLDLTGVAIILPSMLLVLYAYDVVFETFANGRTPGKRAAKLRVVRVGGEPVDFMSSAIRNVLRLVDGIPTSYIPGMISILATKRNQRLGDLAAGTIVIHEDPVQAPRPAMPPPGAGAWAPPQAGPGWQPGPVWDVSRVTPEEVAAVRSFLERRWTLSPEARSRLGLQLADALWPKVGGVSAGLPPEAFLEQVAQQKSLRG